MYVIAPPDPAKFAALPAALPMLGVIVEPTFVPPVYASVTTCPGDITLVDESANVLYVSPATAGLIAVENPPGPTMILPEASCACTNTPVDDAVPTGSDA